MSAQRDGKFLLYLMDVYGNRELIYEGVNNIFHALPLQPRPKPPLIGDRVAWPDREQRQTPQDGVIFSGNVYQGAPPELQGKAKHLRVLHIDPKTYTYWYKRPYISTGPVVSAVQSEGVKRVLGTVPIEADGSVAFRAPPGKALHFQLLDEHYPRAADDAELRRADARRAARLPGLPRVPQPHAAGRTSRAWR